MKPSSTSNSDSTVPRSCSNWAASTEDSGKGLVEDTLHATRIIQYSSATGDIRTLRIKRKDWKIFTFNSGSEFDSENPLVIKRYYVDEKRRWLEMNNAEERSSIDSGEIPRKTDFEKGFPRHRVFSDGKWQPDPWIWDDQAIIINEAQRLGGNIRLCPCWHCQHNALCTENNWSNEGSCYNGWFSFGW